MSAEWDESDYRRQADADLAALAARPAPDDGEALPGPLEDRCGCRRGMGRRDPACHSYGLCEHAAPSSPGSGDALHGRLAEALREHRWTAEETPSGSREEDYRPGAPCMDCGEYPGPRHQRSDCVRALAAALLPVVREAIADAKAEALEDLAGRFSELGAYAAYCVTRARADALRDGTRA